MTSRVIKGSAAAGQLHQTGLSKQLWEKGLEQLQFSKTFDPEQIPPTEVSEALVGHDGASIVRKSVGRSQQLMVSLPGTLEMMVRSCAGQLGSIKDLDSACPTMYVEFPDGLGRLKLRGTYVYPKNPFMALQYKGGVRPASAAKRRKTPGKVLQALTVECRSIFKSVLVFSDWAWIGTANENPSEKPLPLPKELQRIPVSESERPQRRSGSRDAVAESRASRSRSRQTDVVDLLDSEDDEGSGNDEEEEDEDEEEDEVDDDVEARQNHVSVQQWEGEPSTDSEEEEEEEEEQQQQPSSRSGGRKRKLPPARKSAIATKSRTQTPAAARNKRLAVQVSSSSSEGEEESESDDRGSRAKKTRRTLAPTPMRKSARATARVNYADPVSDEESVRASSSSSEEEEEDESSDLELQPAAKRRKAVTGRTQSAKQSQRLPTKAVSRTVSKKAQIVLDYSSEEEEKEKANGRGRASDSESMEGVKTAARTPKRRSASMIVVDSSEDDDDGDDDDDESDWDGR